MAESRLEVSISRRFAKFNAGLPLGFFAASGSARRHAPILATVRLFVGATFYVRGRTDYCQTGG